MKYIKIRGKISEKSEIKKENTIDSLSRRFSNIRASDTNSSGLDRDVSMLASYSLEDALKNENKEDTIKNSMSILKS